MDRPRLIVFLWVLFLARPGAAQETLFALDATRSQIRRYNLETGAVEASFVTPVLCRPEGACGLAYSGHSLYLSDATDPEARIYELNPRDGTLWHSLPAPSDAVDALAFAEGMLYALSFAEDRLYRLDPFDGQVLGVLEPGVDLIGGLGAGGGRLFASCIRPGAIYEIDPEDGQVLRAFPSSGDLPTGLAVAGGGLFVSDFEQERLLRLDLDTGELEEWAAGGSLAALAGGAEEEGAPYALRLERVDAIQQPDGQVDLVLCATLCDDQDRRLETNHHSVISFVASGGGELQGGGEQQVVHGEATVVLRVAPGAAVQVEAQLSGLAPARLTLDAVAPTAEIALRLEGHPEDASLLVGVVRLFDALGEPAVEDESAVAFEVVRGAGVLVGPAVVVPAQGEARTLIRLPRRGTELEVAAQVRRVRQTVSLTVAPAENRSPALADGLVVSSGPAAGRDDRPPAPPAQIRAGFQDGQVEVRWVLSADDEPARWFPFGGRWVRRQSVAGYRIYRSQEGGLYEEMGRVGSGVDRFVDAVGHEPGTYRYKVLAADQDNWREMLIFPGTEADRQRTVVVGGEPGVPVDAEGNPVLGLFNDDGVVDFEDFFLFADHFGLGGGNPDFDSMYDLDGSGVVDFEDFFLFADHFGRVAVARD